MHLLFCSSVTRTRQRHDTTTLHVIPRTARDRPAKREADAAAPAEHEAQREGVQLRIGRLKDFTEKVKEGFAGSIERLAG